MPRTKTWPAFLGLLLLLVTAVGVTLAPLWTVGPAGAAPGRHPWAVDPRPGGHDPRAAGIGGGPSEEQGPRNGPTRYL